MRRHGPKLRPSNSDFAIAIQRGHRMNRETDVWLLVCVRSIEPTVLEEARWDQFLLKEGVLSSLQQTSRPDAAPSLYGTEALT